MKRYCLIFLFAAALAWGADVSGTWEVAVETDMGSGSPVFVFKQEGEKLTGTYSGQLGEARVTGSVKGGAIEFRFEVAPGGDTIQVTYSGKLEGDNRMKGAVDVGGVAKGTFAGRRK